jgi:hypothetical protein
VVISSSIRTATHRNNPSRLRHLIVDLSERRSHLVGERACYDHDIGLTRGGTEDYTKAILIVARGGEMHHFDSAAGESEGHGPKGALTGPVGYLVEGSSGGLLARILFASCHPPKPSPKPNWSRMNNLGTELTGDVQCVLHNTLLPLLTRQRNLASLLARNAHRWRGAWVAMDIMRGRQSARRLRTRGGYGGDRSVWDYCRCWLRYWAAVSFCGGR